MRHFRGVELSRIPLGGDRVDSPASYGWGYQGIMEMGAQSDFRHGNKRLALFYMLAGNVTTVKSTKGKMGESDILRASNFHWKKRNVVGGWIEARKTANDYKDYL